MGLLTQMLSESGGLDNLPVPDRTIYMTLAAKYESNTEFLFLQPEELSEFTNMANADTWQKFLQLIEVQNYVKGQMSFIAQISQRKTFRSLVEQALGGSQQAAKQVQELSGILNQQDTNRVVVLHQIPRPKTEVQ